jgi:hypothetical protein
MPDEVKDGFIRVEDKIYSAEKLANFHPGGPVFVKVSFNIVKNHYLLVDTSKCVNEKSMIK